MAATKISDMAAGTTPQSTDESPWARAGANVKLTYEQIKDAVLASTEAELLVDTARWTQVDSAIVTESLPTIAISTVSFTKSINSSTNASPIVVETTANHGLITGEVVTISGHLVNTNANGTWVIAKVDDTHFQLKTEYLTSPHLTSTGNGVGGATGTVTHDMNVTTSTHHRFNSLQHVVIKSVDGCTAANGIHTIDSGTVRVIDATGSGVSPIVLTTAFPHGFVANSQVRVEGVEGNTAANGIWYISTPSTTTIGLYKAAGPATASTGNGAYNDGGAVSRSKSFRLVGKAGNSAYTSGGTVVIPGRIVVELGTFGLADQAQTDVFPTTTSTTTERQAARAAAEALGFNIGIPVKITQVVPAAVAVLAATNTTPIEISTAGHTFLNGSTVIISGVAGNTNANGSWIISDVTATNFKLVGSGGNAAYTSGGTATPSVPDTLYGIIVGVPGVEGFPYTDPEPLPFFLDDQVQYAGPPLLYDIDKLYLGKPELVSSKAIVCHILPNYGSQSELPVTRLLNSVGAASGTERYRTVGGGLVLGDFGAAFARWDEPDSFIVAFSMQHVTAPQEGATNTLTGQTVIVTPDAARAGTFGSSARAYARTLSAWSDTARYAAQDEVKYRTGGATTAYNHYRCRVEYGLNWSATRAYVVGDVARDTGDTKHYRCIVANTNNDPSSTPAMWELFTPKSNPSYWRKFASGEAWSATINYVPGDYAFDGAELYLCTTASTNEDPSSTPANWTLVDQDIIPDPWVSGDTYAAGNIAYYQGRHFISLQAGNIGNNPLVDDRTLGSPTWWGYATRSTYTDIGLYPGSRARRSFDPTDATKLGNLASWWPTGTDQGDGAAISGHPDTGCVGWRFTALGVETAVREIVSHTEVILESTTLEGQFGPGLHEIADVSRQPRITVMLGGQVLSTNDDHHGTRTRVYANRAQWNPCNEINWNCYDTEYNSRLEIACTGVGNQPGVNSNDPSEGTSYSTGTVTIVDGVVTLVGGTWPLWAAFGTLTLGDETAELTVATRDSASQLTLNQTTRQAASGSTYVLRPGGSPAQYISLFMTLIHA